MSQKKPIQNEDVWDDSELMNAYQTAIDSYWQKHHNPSLAAGNTAASVSNATKDNEDDEEEGELPSKTEADGKSDDNRNPSPNDNIEHSSRSSVKPKRKRSKKSKEAIKSSWDGPIRVASATNAFGDSWKSQNGTAATGIHPAEEVEHSNGGDSFDDDDSHDIERQQAWQAYYESQQAPGWYKWPSQPQTMFPQGGFNFGIPNPFAPTFGMSFPGFGAFGQSHVTMDANMISLLWSAYQAGYAAGANAAVGSPPVSNCSQTPRPIKKKRKIE